MRLLRKIAAVGAEDAALAPSVKHALVESLYAPFASLVVGAMSGAIIATATAITSGETHFALVAAAIAVVGAARIVLARIYIRYRDGLAGSYQLWEALYAAGGFAFAALLSLCALLTFSLSDNVALQAITTSTAIGYGAGISGRNAGRPFIAMGQLILSSLPLSLTLIILGDGPHVSLGVVIILFAYGMIDITMSIREIIVTALVTTREKEALADRFKAQADLFDIALNNMSHGLCMFDTHGHLKVWNRRFIEITGLDRDSVTVGLSARRLLNLCAAEMATAPMGRGSSLGTFEQLQAAFGEGTPILTLPGDRFVSLVQRRTADAEWVVIFEDVTERKRDEARINTMARYDELTGLFNRSSFRTHVDNAIAQGEPFAVHLIDLDRFKAVNDTKGHPTGDQLLQKVAGRLRTAAFGANAAFRIGGDEFVIVQSELETDGVAQRLSDAIIRLMEEPFLIDGSHIAIGASIGTALAPLHAEDGDRLLKCADIALYAAKADGRSTARTFEPAMEAATHARHALEVDLRKALGGGEFELLYQPLIDLETGAIASCEALLRWHHPERGYISPLDFIPVAEETGLILAIGDWVLKEACREAATWPNHVSVAVNLSSVQFDDPHLVLHILTALQASGLSPRRLELEVTETVTLDGREGTVAIFDGLKALGVRLSLDDFGTGYSSLSYLNKYAFDKLKIDRSFVNDLTAQADSVAIIRAIVGMGRSLGMTIVVEGIETQAQLDILRNENCDLGQGYLFSRPIPATALRSLMADNAKVSRTAA